MKLSFLKLRFMLYTKFILLSSGLLLSSVASIVQWEKQFDAIKGEPVTQTTQEYIQNCIDIHNVKKSVTVVQPSEYAKGLSSKFKNIVALPEHQALIIDEAWFNSFSENEKEFLICNALLTIEDSTYLKALEKKEQALVKKSNFISRLSLLLTIGASYKITEKYGPQDTFTEKLIGTTYFSALFYTTVLDGIVYPLFLPNISDDILLRHYTNVIKRFNCVKGCITYLKRFSGYNNMRKQLEKKYA